MTSQSDSLDRRTGRRTAAALFAFALFCSAATVAGPGLSWDEPAYRHSQVTLQSWFHELGSADSFTDLASLWSADSIHRYWEFNRFGHNFHPPMASLLNLATWAAFHRLIDDVSARRLASALELSAAVAGISGFLAARYGWKVGAFAGLSLLFTPRVMGEAHIIGTDMPLLFFWGAAAIFFWNGRQSRAAQWLFAAAWGCLFLVKFTGAALLLPLAAWFLVDGLIGRSRRTVARWALWSALIAIPVAPLAIALLFGADDSTTRGVLADFARHARGQWSWLVLLFFWPLVGLVTFYATGRRRSAVDWKPILETPWVALAVSPLVVILLNPSWHHDAVGELARYFHLNFAREGHLPDIGIFYLGKRYLYSLPWHSGWVMIAVTVPVATLLLSLLGVARAVAGWRTDRLPMYLLVQALALPLLRIFPTPSHDGVRLILPTFFFLAGLAGLGAGWIAAKASLQTRWAWPALFLIGPGWSAVDWIRIHPYELSYYNFGLRRAMDWGFEPTYWYDAVTPRVLADLNERLPRNVAIGFPDPLINPEVFQMLQELGRLRGDVRFDTHDVKGLPWYWLLTHSSKATSFTRLLYACKPWQESGVDGVRLFSVVDEKGSGLAWALYALTVTKDQSAKLGPLEIFEPVFHAKPEEIQRAVALAAKGKPSRETLAAEPPAVRAMVEQWTDGATPERNLKMVLERAPGAIDQAIEILTTRSGDVRKVLQTPGYLRPEQFGGYFLPDEKK